MSNYLSELTLPNGEEYLLKDAEARRELLTKANSIDNEDYTEEYVKTFYSDATGCRIGYEIQLEPKQDMHGYEYPWQGGAGKNLLGLSLSSIKTLNTTYGTWDGNSYTRNAVTFNFIERDGYVERIECSGTASGNTSLVLYSDETGISANNYIFSGCTSGGGSSKYCFV